MEQQIFNFTPPERKKTTDYADISTTRILLTALYLLILILLFLLTSCASVPPVYKVNSQTDMKGIYYCLPKNILHVQVTVTHKTYQKGALFQDYTNLIPEAIDTTFKYKVSNVTISNSTIADQSQWYCVVFDKNFGKDVTISFERSSDGCLYNVNTEAQDKSVDKTAQAFSVVTNVIAGTVDSTNTSKREVYENVNSDVLGIFFNDKSTQPATQPVKAIDNSKKQTVTKTYTPSRDKAMDLAQEYDRIRTEKLKLISGQQSNVHDLQLFNEMLFQLEQRQNEIVELFYGKIVTSKLTIDFQTDKNILDTILFYYNPDKGLISNTNKSTIDKCCRPDSLYIPFRIQIKQNNFGLNIQYNEFDRSQSNEGSFYYRIPGEVNTTVSLGQTVIKDTLLLMAQAGEIARLPKRAGFLRTRYDIVFDPVTGAMIKLSVNEGAISKAIESKF